MRIVLLLVWPSLLLLGVESKQPLGDPESPLLSFAQPEQIHLSWTGSSGSMFVTWSTLDKTRSSYVEWAEAGERVLRSSSPALQTTFVDGGAAKRSQRIHRAKMSGLIPGRSYTYHVGSADGWSSRFTFAAVDPGRAARFAVVADFGLANARTLGQLQRETQEGRYDVVLHVGDMAYDLHRLNATVGDQWLRQVEPVAAYVPYMTVPGNHEWAYNFSHYTARFTMPHFAERNNSFYSFDMGPVHVVGFSTEYYFFWQFFAKDVEKQFRWLVQDLKKANANRARVPWIVTMGHRPMYCSNSNHFDCSRYDSRTRLGLNGSLGLEDLFHREGVDLALWGHEHSYERLWPTYNRTVYNGTGERPYRDPVATVHVVTGAAGDVEGQCPFLDEIPPWTAFRSMDYGFGRFFAPNATHLLWEQTSVERGGEVLDSFWITKTSPRPKRVGLGAERKGHLVPSDYVGPGLRKFLDSGGKEGCHMPRRSALP